MISLFGCKSYEDSYKDKFLSYVHQLAPEPYKECLVEHIRENWDEAFKTFNLEKGREPRGETDVVRFMIGKYLPLCEMKVN